MESEWLISLAFGGHRKETRRRDKDNSIFWHSTLMTVIDSHWQLYNTLNQVSFNAGQKLQMNSRYIEWWNMKSINPLDPKTMYLQKQWFPAHEQWTCSHACVKELFEVHWPCEVTIKKGHTFKHSNIYTFTHVNIRTLKSI